MSPEVQARQRRYRRRIIGLGALLFVLCFLIPAPFVIDWVEDDLEDRTAEELAAEGVTGVTIRFSGQDGTVACDAPLGDVAAARSIIEDEWGVRTVEFEDECVAGGSAGVEDENDLGAETAADTTADTAEGSTEAATSTTTTVAPETATLASVIGEDPQFSQLAGLLASTGLDETLAVGGPLTLFAPTDAAFDLAFEALGSDGFAELTADPALVEQVLLHHVTEGALSSTDLAPGELDMLDGTQATVGVDADDTTLTSGDTVATVDPEQRDTLASNGIVHAVDMVLLPADVMLGAPATLDPDVTAVWADGRLVLNGVVASEAQQAAVVAPIAGVLEPANIDDQLTIDADRAVSDEDVDRLASIVAAMPRDLVEGTTTLTGSEITIVGVDTGTEAATAFQDAAAASDATVELTSRADADPDTAARLQDALNGIVGADPIVFQPNSADLTDASVAVVERVAAVARSLGGTSILVVGHTDSDGQAATNQQLSEDRAAAVADALVGEGLDADSLSSEGRGQTEPIIVDGVEDKDASRRVEFVVTAT